MSWTVERFNAGAPGATITVSGALLVEGAVPPKSAMRGLAVPAVVPPEVGRVAIVLSPRALNALAGGILPKDVPAWEIGQ